MKSLDELSYEDVYGIKSPGEASEASEASLLKQDTAPAAPTVENQAALKGFDPATRAPDDRMAALKASMFEASRAPVQQNANVVKLAKESGLPEPLAARNPERAAELARLNSVDTLRLLNEFPDLAKKLEDPNFAKISYDDIPFLESVDTYTKDLGKAHARGNLMEDESYPNGLNWLFDPANPEYAEEYAEIQKKQKELESTTEYNWLTGTPMTILEMLPLMQGTAVDAAPMIVAGTGMGLIAGSVAAPGPGTAAGGIVGAYTGYTIGSSQWMGVREAALAFPEFITMKDENGLAMEPGLAQGAATVVGVLNGLLEIIPGSQLMKSLGGRKAAAALMREGVKETLRNPTYRKMFLEMGKRVALQSGAEGFTEMMQEMTVMVSGRFLKIISEGDYADMTTDDLVEGFNRAWESFYMGTQGGAGIGLAASIPQSTIEARQIQQAKANLETIKEMTEQTRESKTYERSKEIYESYLQASLEENGAPAIGYVDVRGMANILRANDQNAHQIFKDVLGVEDAVLQEMLETGGDLQVPLAKFITQLQDNPAYDALIGELKLNADGLTPRQSLETQARQEQLIVDENESLLAESEQQDSITQMGDDIFNQLVEQGANAKLPEGVMNPSLELARQFAINAVLRGRATEEQVRKYFDVEIQRNAFDPEADTSGVLEQGAPGFENFVGDTRLVEEHNGEDFTPGEGVTVKVYHGTTHDITAFQGGRGNRDGHYGAATAYTTNDTLDASKNYASPGGPDLKARINQRAEQIELDTDSKEMLTQYWTATGQMTEGNRNSLEEGDLDGFDVYEASLYLARQELQGPNEGNVMPLYMRLNNPVIVGSNAKETQFTLDQDTAEGSLADFFDALAVVGPYFDIEDVADLREFVYETTVGNEGISASDLEDVFRKELGLVIDPITDEYIGAGQILAETYEAMGFDGIIQNDPNEAFGEGKGYAGMQHMDANTRHFMSFKDSKIKSATGNRGTFDDSDPNILMQENEGDGPTTTFSRGERNLAKKTRLSSAEKALINELAKATPGLTARVIDMRMRAIKAQYPVADGWAPLTLTAVTATPKKGKAAGWVLTPTFRDIPYSFDQVNEAEVTQRLLGVIRDIRARKAGGDESAAAILREEKWYTDVQSLLRERYGSLGDLFADILGATSPQTTVAQGYASAVDALGNALAGKYDNVIDEVAVWSKAVDQRELDFETYKKEQQALGKTLAWMKDNDPEYQRLVKKVPLKVELLSSNGKRFGVNSRLVAKALGDLFRTINVGSSPKTKNFSANLIGFTDAATIDMWAARLLQDLAGRPRIPVRAETGVTGEHLIGSTLAEPVVDGAFGFGQRVFREAANELGMTASDLQAVVWFYQKEIWTNADWTTKQGEGGSIADLLRGNLTDRFVGLLSKAQSIENQGQDIPATPENMQPDHDRLRDVAYQMDGIVAAKSTTTLGRYGADEVSFDIEVVVKHGASVDPVWNEMVRIAQENNQRSVGMSRRLADNESFDYLQHNPGLELYFDRPTDLDVLAPVLEQLAGAEIEFFTMATDGRPHASVRAGEMGKVTGLRVLHVPQFEGAPEGFETMSDDALIAHMKERALDLQEMRDAAREIDGVAYSEVVYFENHVLFSEDYPNGINNTTGSSGGEAADATATDQWRGDSIREGFETANRIAQIQRDNGTQAGDGDVSNPGRAEGTTYNQEVTAVQDTTKIDPWAMSIEELLEHPMILQAEAQSLSLPQTDPADPARFAIQEEARATVEALRYGGHEVLSERKVWLVLGLPASGKSTLVEGPKGLAATNGAVVIDADDTKLQLPEFAKGIGANAVHLESKKISTKMQEQARDEGHNIIESMLGADYDKLLAKIDDYQSQGYTVSVKLVDVPVEETLRRSVARYQSTGRYVPLGHTLHGVGYRPAENYVQLLKEGVTHDNEAYSSEVPEGDPLRRITQPDAELLGRRVPEVRARSTSAVQGGTRGVSGDGREQSGQGKNQKDNGRQFNQEVDLDDASQQFRENIDDDGNYTQVQRKTRASADSAGDVQPTDAVQNRAILTGTESLKEVDVGFKKLDTPAKIARASISLSDYPQEKFWAVALDQNDMPIAILEHTSGVKAASLVDSGVVAGWAVNTPNAKKLYISHNHPSDTVNLSDSDLNTSRSLADLMDGSGVEVMGIMAVSPTHYMFEGGPTDQPIPEPETSNKTSVVQRTMQRIEAGEFPNVTDDVSAKAALKIISGGENGVMLLNTQYKPVGFLPFDFGGDGLTLRGGKLDVLLKAIESTNASAAILQTSAFGAAEVNVSNMLAAAQITVLDAMASGQSARDAGAQIQTGARFTQDSNGKKAPPRGSIAFTGAGVADGGTIINLFESANLTTLLHESGHLYLEIMRDMAAMPDASPQLKADMQALYQWFGTMEIAREQHEQFARGFEAWLREGKVSNPILKGPFQQFRAWLLHWYKSIGALRVELTPEVRDVMDRMLSSDEDIAQAKEAAGVLPAFKRPDDIGMAEAEFAELAQQMTKAIDEATLDLQTQLIKESLRGKEQAWRDERKLIAEQVEQEFAQNQVFILKSVLMNGTLPLGEALPAGMTPMKLNSAAIAEMGIRVAPNMTAKEGYHPDHVAELFGYESGLAMLREMAAVPGFKTAVKAEAEKRMIAIHGDLMANHAERAEVAIAAMHNAELATFIKAELDAIEKKAGLTPTVRQVLKRAAERIVKGKRISAISAKNFVNQQQKFAREAQRLVADKDYRGAADAKRKQLLNFYMFREAHTVEQKQDKMRLYLRKFDKASVRKNIDRDVLDSIDALTSNFELRSSASVTRTDPALRHWKTLTWEEANNLVAAVKEFETFGRDQHRMDVEGEIVREEALAAELKALAKAHLKWSDKPYRDGDSSGSMFEKLSDWRGSFASSLRKAEFIFHALDGDKAGGLWWKSIFKPLANAENAELTMQEQAVKAMDKVLNRYERKERIKWYNEKLSTGDILGVDLTKNQLLTLAMNWGNEGNRLAVIEGSHRYLREGRPNWTESQVNTALSEHLDKRDWDYVKDVWAMIDAYWPAIAEQERELTGSVPEKVEPLPFQTKHGLIKGGYFPLKADPRLTNKAQQRDAKESIEDMFGAGYKNPNTKHGHTVERLGFGGNAVMLSQTVISDHISRVIHDLTHRKALLQADRLLRNEDISDAIKRTLGLDAYNELRPWLNNIATSMRKPDVTPLTTVMGHFRRTSTVVNMGWKMTTAIVQPLGFFNTVEMLGGKWSAYGLTEYLANPAAAQRRVFEKSVMMRNRAKTFDRDVNEMINTSKRDNRLHQIQKTFLWHIGFMDLVVSVPTWLGAYEKARTAGLTEPQAIAEGDSMVRMSQSSGGAKDLANIQAGSDLQKMFTMFYSYFNVLYNQMQRAGRKAQRQSPAMAVAGLMQSFTLLVLIPALLSEIITARWAPWDDDEPEEKLLEGSKIIAGYMAGTVPFVRDIASASISDFGYAMTPLSQALSTIASLPSRGVEFAKDPEIEKSDVKAMAMATGYFLGLPARQAFLTGEHVWDVLAEGDDFSMTNLLLTKPPK